MSVLLGFFAFAVVLVFASASGDGRKCYIHKERVYVAMYKIIATSVVAALDEVSVPVTVLIVAGAAALAIIVLCVLGWGLLLVLGLYFRHSRYIATVSTWMS